MCAAVAARPERIFPGFTGEVRAEVEAPCGHGFVDVLARTIGPIEEIRIAIVEVKTKAEPTTAGDVIRQLKFYEQRMPLDGPVRLVLVVEDEGGVSPAMLALLAHEDVEVLPIRYFERDAA
jgi:RecB family endonuclease NucS